MRINEICLSSGEAHGKAVRSGIYDIYLVYPEYTTQSSHNEQYPIMKQLVMMKHSSVFINDAAEAGRLIKEMPSKGSIYGAFRYDVTVPDMLGEFFNTDFYRS